MATTLDQILPSYGRELLTTKARGTHKTYTAAVRALSHWLMERGESTALDDISRTVMREFVSARGQQVRPATVSTEFRALRRFFLWCVDEGEIGVNPMERLPFPRVPVIPPDVYTDVEIKKMVAACVGRRYLDIRDMALLRLFLDTGMRRSELVYLRLKDVDLDRAVVSVVGKGGRGRDVPVGPKTVAAARQVSAFQGVTRACWSF